MKTINTCNKVFLSIAFVFLFVTNSFGGRDYETIDTVKLHSMIVDNAYEIEGGRQKKFIVVDSRTPKEYNRAHIFSSISVPENDFEKSMRLLPQDKNVLLIVYGNGTGNDTVRTWANKAAAAGYLNIVIYRDGFPVWKENRMPTASRDGI